MLLLEDVDTPHGNIKILESSKDGTITYYQGECFQSQIDKHGTSTCAYIHVMKNVMMSINPKRVLVIGGAGGTLATLLHREGCHVTMLDINAYAFTLAKRYFQLPDGVECIDSDGYAYLQTSNASFDAIAIDAFNGKGIIPMQLRKKAFFRLCREAVGEAGVVVMNVMTTHDLDLEADRIAEKMIEAGMPVVLYDWAGTQDRNTLVTAGQAIPLQIPSGDEPAWLKKELQGISCRTSLL